MTITEFLLAQIAEDERVAQAWKDDGEWGMDAFEQPAADFIARIDAGSVLAECEAKRRIVGEHFPMQPERAYCRACNEGQSWPCWTLRYLASVYSDHPDYDEAWRP